MEPTKQRSFSTNTNNTMPQNLNLHCNLSPAHHASNRTSSIYDTDEFRMYKFKVLVCQKHFSHDWTSCPFTHYGERARRRDPRKHLPVLCPFFKDKEICRRGESCKFAHGLFEYFLHPGKYRTSECMNGTKCDRRVCFFAHTKNELRPEMLLSCDEIYEAFSFNARMPVARAPRQVLRALAARTKLINKNTSTDAKEVVAPSARDDATLATADPSASSRKGKEIASDDDSSRVADASRSLLGLDYYSPASIWSAALSSWPYDFSGLTDILKEMSDDKTSRNSKLDEDAPVREYRLWN